MPRYISSLPGPDFASAFPRALVILGSTGSIGRSSLKVVAKAPGDFTVLGLAGARNIRLLAEQADQFRPRFLGVLAEQGARELRALLPRGYRPDIFVGTEGYAALASHPLAMVVLSAQVGAAGLAATLSAAQAGKVIALANKESLVLAGGLIREACSQTGAVVLPVDSEHNGVFQTLSGQNPDDITRIILTASGGPFRGRDREFLAKATPDTARRHHTWSMGPKICIDSATLMNKGLEVIEAHHLFGLDLDRIDVLVHPQSVVHALAEFRDGSLLAHLGPTDMQVAIAHSLAWPRRLRLGLQPLDLARLGSLTFELPDMDCFPCLGLAMEALRRGQAAAVALNAANEEAVEKFLAREIGFLGLPNLIRMAMQALAGEPAGCFEAIVDLDRRTREKVRQWVANPRT